MPCAFMARVVESVASKYDRGLKWEKVVTKTAAGAKRFFELSRVLGRRLPVPSIILNGKIVFDSIPGTEELETLLDRELQDAGKVR